MPALYIKALPEIVYQRLKEKAERKRRSLSQVAVALLRQGLGTEIDHKARRARLLAEILSKGTSDRAARLPDPVRLVREGRDR